MGQKKRLMLIDGHALVYRAYHAIPPLTGPSGEPTNAVFGFTSMLLKAIQDAKPDYIIATFDVGRTFRHDEYQAYKANRAEAPDDLSVQFRRVEELLKGFGIPMVAREGFEADDLLGTLAKQAAEQGVETIIVTGDSDTFQLVTEDVSILTPRHTFGDVQVNDKATIRERYGLEPSQLVDLKALVGDTSDNIPGVSGVGEKTALALLQKYGSIEAIYERLDEVTPQRFRRALEVGRESAFLSKRLATIVRDVDVALDLESSRWGRLDRERVMTLFRELGFHALVTRIPQPEAKEAWSQGSQLGLFGDQEVGGAAQGEASGEYCAVDTPEALSALAARLRQASCIALDTETTSTEPMRARLVGISVAVAEGEAYYVPLGHDERLHIGQQLPIELVRETLAPILADPRISKVCHNAIFDLIVLRRHGLPVEGLTVDTMIAAWLLEPEARGIGLKSQAFQRLGVEMTTIDGLIGTGRNRITMDQVSIARVSPYACADADMTFRLVDALRPELEERNQWHLLTNVEMPLLPVLMRMEMRGMAIDVGYLKEMSGQISQRLFDLERQIHEQAGHRFNINSTKQLGVVLFEELKLPVVKRTQTGYSTDVSVLEELRDKHPILPLILEYRQLDKLKGTYVDALPALVNPETGRVHTSFNQAGASTGRLSSSEPNLQNIPVRTDVGRQVRRAFIAPEGYLLLDCDYSQVELRLLAHLSRDPELMGAFHRGEDVHASTAAAIFGVPLASVTKDQRSLAKTINFGLMYGMGGYTLSSRTDLSVPEATAFIGAYFARFGAVREYLDSTLRRAQQQGYVETILGRRRYFPELRPGNAANVSVRRGAERAAVNMPIQGSAADIIKLAMIALDRRLGERHLGARLVLQVHDDLVLEVPELELDETRALVVETMEHAYALDVPLRVEACVGKNWMEMS